MGRMAISLWEEAAPLERNRTGCEGGGRWWLLSNWHCRSRSGTKNKQKTPLLLFVPAGPPLLWTSLAPAWRSCLAGQKASFCSRSLTAEPWNWDANNFPSACRLKTTHKHQTAGGWGFTRRHQHGPSRLWTCSDEERKLWWCYSFSTPCEYWSPIQRWKRSRWMTAQCDSVWDAAFQMFKTHESYTSRLWHLKCFFSAMWGRDRGFKPVLHKKVEKRSVNINQDRNL